MAECLPNTVFDFLMNYWKIPRDHLFQFSKCPRICCARVKKSFKDGSKNWDICISSKHMNGCRGHRISLQRSKF